MMAVGSAVAAGAELAGVRAGGFGFVAGCGVEAACAAPSRDVEIIRTSVCNRVRMDAPVSILASFNCTTIDPIAGGVPGVLARQRCCYRRTGGRARRPSLHLLFLFRGLRFAAHSFGLAKNA